MKSRRSSPLPGKKPLFLLGLVVLTASVAAENLPLVPYPKSVILGGRKFIPKDLRIEADQTLLPIASLLQSRIQLPLDANGSQTLRLKIDPSLPTGREGYRLTIDEKTIELTGKDQNGLKLGTATLKQLWSANGVPTLKIQDEPSMVYRGLMLDPARHFLPVEDLKRLIEEASLLKLNRVHLHLTDEGGWRLEVPTIPALTERSAFRLAQPAWDRTAIEFVSPSDPREKHGGFYSRQQIRELVEYSHERGVALVPEVDLPSHARALVHALPDLKCGPNPDTVCPSRPETWEFVRQILDQLVEDFPDVPIHLGGDEYDLGNLQKCPLCVKFGVRSLQELFNRSQSYLRSKRREMVLWDNAAEQGFAPKGSIIQLWRKRNWKPALEKLGFKILQSPVRPTYLDLPLADNLYADSLSWKPGPSPLAEACLWGEDIFDRIEAERALFPRLFALSESMWHRNSLVDAHVRIGNFARRWMEWGYLLSTPPPLVDQNVTTTSAERITVESNGLHGAEMFVEGIPTTQSSLELQPGQTAWAESIFNGLKSEPQAYRSISPKPRTPLGLSSGLKVALFEPQGPNQVQFKGSLTLPKLSIDPSWRHKPFTAVFTGFLKLPQSGWYRFRLRSCQASTFKLGPDTLLVQPTVRAKKRQTVNVWLEKGAYEIEVTVQREVGEPDLRLDIRTPAGDEFEVPPNWYGHKG